jgi:hypothetical protein
VLVASKSTTERKVAAVLRQSPVRSTHAVHYEPNHNLVNCRKFSVNLI